MSGRFFIDCYGIIDNWRRDYDDCRDKLSWSEVCETLNELDALADDKLDEYEYIVKLENENKFLKDKLSNLESLSKDLNVLVDEITNEI